VRVALKLTAVILGLLISVLALEGWLRVQHEREVFEHDLEHEQRLLGRALLPSVELAWRTEGAEAAERILVQEPDQEMPLHLEDVKRALLQLPDKQREMLLLVAGAGLTYEEAASVADCNIGTVKSRLNRGRAAIRAVVDGASDIPAAARGPRPE